MFVLLLLALVLLVLATVVVLAACMMFARISRLEEGPEITRSQRDVLPTTEDWPAAANPGLYNQLLS